MLTAGGELGAVLGETEARASIRSGMVAGAAEAPDPGPGPVGGVEEQWNRIVR